MPEPESDAAADKGENWMTVDDFLSLVEVGAIGPDDGATFYLIRDENGTEREIAFGHPNEIPSYAIGIMFYGK